MKKSILIFVLLVSGLIQAQEKGIIEGIVLDKQMKNAPLAFATITLKENNINTNANIDGAYVLELNEGVYTLMFNFPGYQKITVKNVSVKAGKITSIQNIALSARELMLPDMAKTSKKEK